MQDNSDTPKTPQGKEDSLPLSPQKPTAVEIGGRGGLDPVRYGDWEIGGKCVDF